MELQLWPFFGSLVSFTNEERVREEGHIVVNQIFLLLICCVFVSMLECFFYMEIRFTIYHD